MRKYGFSILIFLLVFNFGGVVIEAQSDYEITQNFKSGYDQITEAIKNAGTLDECISLEQKILDLKNNFAVHKELLDRSLYPETFDSSFEKILNTLMIRKQDFSQITELQTVVGELKDQISELNRKNEALITEIKILESIQRKDKRTIDSLNTLVSNLRTSIRKRDELVTTVVDSLLAEYLSAPSTLSDAESQSFINKVESKNIFVNVRRTIEDNIQFMEVTELNYDDMIEMKQHQSNFSKLWRQIGSKLAEVYLKRNERAIEIGQIDGLFREWNRKINDKIWSSIDELFRQQKIVLLRYNNGQQFTDNVSLYIEDEIKNYGVKSKEESEKTLYAFADSVWFNELKPEWVPMLIENNLLTEAQKDTVESKIAKWKEIVSPVSYSWIYWIIGIILVVLLLIIFRKSRQQNISQSAGTNQPQ